MADVLAFPVGRTGTRSRRRRDAPAAQPVTSLVGREERQTVMQAAIGGWERISAGVGEEVAQEAFKIAAHRSLTTLTASGTEDVTLNGSPTRPQVTALFRWDDHPRRGLVAAVALRSALAELPEAELPGVSFDVHIGLHTAGAADFVVGENDPMPFRAVGSLFSLAARLQEEAEPGQILLSADLVTQVAPIVSVHSQGEIALNRHGEMREAFCLLGLHLEDGA